MAKGREAFYKKFPEKRPKFTGPKFKEGDYIVLDSKGLYQISRFRNRHPLAYPHKVRTVGDKMYVFDREGPGDLHRVDIEKADNACRLANPTELVLYAKKG